MICAQEGCEAEAVAIAHWHGQDTKQCEEHCRALDDISKFMGGGSLVFTDLTTGIAMRFTERGSNENR